MEVVIDNQETEEVDQLRKQLRVVFDTCDTEGEGVISIKELGNISRSHVGSGHVDQILTIFDSGEETQDKIDFEQFYQKFVEFMNSSEKGEDNNMLVSEQNSYNNNTNMTYLNVSPSVQSQGVFNENLRRSFDKNIISTPSSPYKSSATKDADQKKMRRKISQARLSGRIPLVNTSSEDEAEDSFDRRIASSLALARPLEMKTEFLVRGSSTRSTIRKSSNNSRNPSPNISARRKVSAPTPSSTIRMYPTIAHSEGSSLNSPISSSSPHSDQSGHVSPGPGRGNTRLALDELQLKVGRLAENKTEEHQDYDSPSSGLGSLRVDLEEEISASLLLARKHGEERLAVERQRHADQLEGVERERNLERKNFQLRFEQFQEEQDTLKKEVDQLKEKLKLVNLEKESMETQMVQLVEQQRCQSPVRALQDRREMEEQRRRDREEELMSTVQRLTTRVQTQDQDLAEAKEDNIVLRSQIRSLKGEKRKEGKEGGRFKLFGGGKEIPSGTDLWEDPQDIREKLRQAEQDLVDQKEVNNQLKQYVGEVLVNIMVKNPQILQKD